MSDRDQFAAAALAGLIGAAYAHDACGGQYEALARQAYRLADAMLSARGPQPAKRPRKPARSDQYGLFAAGEN